MRPRTALFGAIGILSTAVGASLLLVPDVVTGLGPVDAVVSAAGTLDTATVGIFAGVLVVASLFVTARTRSVPTASGSQSSAGPRFEGAATSPPEVATVGAGSLTAAGVDNDIRTAVAEGDDSLEDVRLLLYETVTSVYAERAGVPVPQAGAIVDRGDWTDDPVAAVFLADVDGPDAPLGMRLRLWLTPRRERTRRIERTVAAIERVSDT